MLTPTPSGTVHHGGCSDVASTPGYCDFAREGPRSGGRLRPSSSASDPSRSAEISSCCAGNGSGLPRSRSTPPTASCLRRRAAAPLCPVVPGNVVLDRRARPNGVGDQRPTEAVPCPPVLLRRHLRVCRRLALRLMSAGLALLLATPIRRVGMSTAVSTTTGRRSIAL